MTAAHRPGERARFPAAAPMSWHSCKLRPQRRGNGAMWGGTPDRRAQRRSSMGATDNLGCTGHDGLGAVGGMGAYNSLGAVGSMGAWKA
jgi:hypothetical protein